MSLIFLYMIKFVFPLLIVLLQGGLSQKPRNVEEKIFLPYEEKATIQVKKETVL